MYFKNFPSFLYDFEYGHGKSKTAVVMDVTRNVRVKKEILSNVSLYDEYDIIDGETPEIISEKFYGTPEYHWIIMLANDKYDYISDFPLQETYLQKHIKTSYNPTMYSDDWYWKRDTTNGKIYIYLRITGGTNDPFDPLYLTAPVKITLSDPTKTFTKVINFPYDEIGLDVNTQHFYFPYTEESIFGPITQFGVGDSEQGVGTVRIYADTEGREDNPVQFINQDGLVVNGSYPGAIPITGAMMHRRNNDMKRRIKIISPSLIEVILKNYEDLTR